VVLALQFFGMPSVFEGLISDLAGDHRVVVYDVRGTGGSKGTGPYDMDTDAEDLIALIEHAGGPALIIPVGDGINRAIRVAAARSDLVSAVLSPAGNPVAREAAEGTDALVASASVVEAMTGMVLTDYRAALRALFSSANKQMTEEALRDRVQGTIEYCPHEVAVARMKPWVEDNIADISREVGSRLWLLEHGRNPWFPIEIMKRTRELLPEAHIEEVDDGPLSRPDITASYVRRILADERETSSKGVG